jgi:hypothetical protein
MQTHRPLIVSLFVLTLFSVRPSIAFEVNPFTPQTNYWTPETETVAGFDKALRLASRVTENMAYRIKKVHASTCRQTLVLSEFMDTAELSRPSSPASPKIANSLKTPAHSVSELFEIIQTTVIGRAILKKFLKSFGYENKIEFHTAKEISQISKQAIGVPALAFYAPMRKAIWIDRNAERGQVAYVLLHEIVHALDRDYDLAVSKLAPLTKHVGYLVMRVTRRTSERTRKAFDQLTELDFTNDDINLIAKKLLLLAELQSVQVFRTERFAYDASYDVQKELSKLYPRYYTGPFRQPNDDGIIRVNALFKRFVDLYKDNQCELVQSEDL